MKYLFTLLVILLPLFSFSQWTTQATGFADSLRGLQNISVVNENIVWATAYDGSSTGASIQEFTRTVDGGATWVAGLVSGVAGHEPSMIFALNADTAWAMYHDPNNDGGKIMRTNDGGLTWTHQSTALFTDSLGAYPNLVYFWNANEGFAMGDPTNGYFEIYTTSNGGNVWTRVPMTNMPILISGEYGYEGEFSVIGSTILFGTSKGRLFKSIDKGYNWTAVNTPMLNTGKVRIVEFRDSMNGIISDRVSNALVMYETSNGGSTWQAIAPSGPVYFNDLQYVPGTQATYVSTGDKSGYTGASISHDGGHTWTEISSPLGTAYGTAGFSSGMVGWAGQLSHGPTQGGAAKFTLLSNDAGLWHESWEVPNCSGTYGVTCHVMNEGVGLLQSVEIHWTVNGMVQPTTNHSFSLPPFYSAMVNLGTYTFQANNTYNIKIYASLPNGLADTTNTNDTLQYSTTINQSPQVNLGPDTSLHAANSITLNAGSGYASYWWSTGESTQTIIVDSSGVGIGTKQISVEVIDGNGCGGVDTIMVGFHVMPGTGDNCHSGGEVIIYPNPMSDQLHFESSIHPVINLRILDSRGRMVKSVSQPKSNEGIDVNDLSPGIYIVQIYLAESMLSKKIILSRP